MLQMEYWLTQKAKIRMVLPGVAIYLQSYRLESFIEVSVDDFLQLLDKQIENIFPTLGQPKAENGKEWDFYLFYSSQSHFPRKITFRVDSFVFSENNLKKLSLCTLLQSPEKFCPDFSEKRRKQEIALRLDAKD